MARVVDHLRAVGVLLHVGAVLALAAPAPVGLTAGRMKSPSMVDTLAGWGSALRGVGLSISDEALGAAILEGSAGVLSVRRQLLSPIRPYERLAGIHQGWTMFGMLNRHPARLELHTRSAGGDWVPLYIARDPVADWEADLFDHERFRGATNAFSWGEAKKRYERFADWVAQRAADQGVAGDELRVSMVRLKLVDPADYIAAGALPTEGRRWERLYKLQALR